MTAKKTFCEIKVILQVKGIRYIQALHDLHAKLDILSRARNVILTLFFQLNACFDTFFCSLFRHKLIFDITDLNQTHHTIPPHFSPTFSPTFSLTFFTAPNKQSNRSNLSSVYLVALRQHGLICFSKNSSKVDRYYLTVKFYSNRRRADVIVFSVFYT